MISWMASKDQATDSQTRDELTSTIYDGLYDEKLKVQPITEQKLNIVTDINTYDQGYDQGYDITITNEEKLIETNEVLKDVELQAKSLTLPTYYIKTTDQITAGDYRAGKFSQEGDYYVFDLSSVYDGRFLLPSQSYEFRVSTAEKPEIKNIQEVAVAQKVSVGGEEISYQTIYNQKNLDNPPIISGVEDIEIKKNSQFDPYQGVAASDIEDGDLTQQLIVENEVDTTNIGQYFVYYYVSDSDNNELSINRKVEVLETGVPEFSGLNNSTIIETQEYNPLLGVSANDLEDGDLTKEIKVK